LASGGSVTGDGSLVVERTAVVTDDAVDVPVRFNGTSLTFLAPDVTLPSLNHQGGILTAANLTVSGAHLWSAGTTTVGGTLLSSQGIGGGEHGRGDLDLP